MKSKIIACSLLIILASAAPAFAGKHKGGKKAEPPPAQTPTPPPAEPPLPSARLSQFNAAHLDQVLAPIDQKPALPRTEVSQLRASFADAWSKAPAPEKAQYQLAAAVCDQLNSAMDERETAMANLQIAAAQHGPSDLNATRALNPDWRDLTREKREARGRKQAARQTDNAMLTQQKANWTQRAQQLRQSINALTARQQAAERAAEQSKMSAASPSPTPLTATPLPATPAPTPH